MISAPLRQTRAAALALWVATLLLVGRSAALPPLERSTAFIGYAEADAGAASRDAVAAVPPHGGVCRDRRESCEGDASSNGCLTNPYVMRRMCPISCAVEPCISSGTAGQARAAKRGAARRRRVPQQTGGRWPAAPQRAQHPSPPPTTTPPAPHAQAAYRYAGAATADGTWAYGEAFRADKGERGTAADHYNSVYYMQGANGAREAQRGHPHTHSMGTYTRAARPLGRA